MGNIAYLICSLFLFQSPTVISYDIIPGDVERPNFILIMADDLGYGDVSCFGNSYINTPNIDQLAEEGILFTDFHSNGTVCSPTRAALMTGKYQQRTGVNGVITAANHRNVGLAIDEVTIADELQAHGYSTGIFGKWHLGYAPEFNPTLQGFDQFKGYVSGNVDYHAHIDQEGYFDWWDNKKLKQDEGYSTDLITQYGIDFIKENNPQKTGKPFFLYLPHEAPHYPYQRRNDKPVRQVGVKGTKGIQQDSIPGIYKGMVEVMDEGIGRIMQTLSEEGLDENTIVLFFSDNGASKNGSNGKLKGYKGSVYEGGHRVPAVAWFPSSIRPNTVCDETVLTMDILPTILDFINEKPQSDVDGISVKGLLLHDEKLPERDLFWSFKGRRAIRSGRWKMVSSTVDGIEVSELYDISKDIYELNNLASNKQEVLSALKIKLEDWVSEVGEGAEVVSQ